MYTVGVVYGYVHHTRGSLRLVRLDRMVVADGLLEPLVRPVDTETRGDAGVRGVLELDLPALVKVVVVGVQRPNPSTENGRRKVLK